MFSEEEIRQDMRNAYQEQHILHGRQYRDSPINQHF